MIKFRRLCAPSCPWGLSFASPTDASRPVCLIPCVWPRSPIFKAPGGLWVSDRSVCILFALHSLPTPQFETQCFTTSITLWKGSLLSFLPLYILPSGMYFFFISRSSSSSICNPAAEHCCAKSHHQAEWCHSRSRLRGQSSPHSRYSPQAQLHVSLVPNPAGLCVLLP